jgi:hypothetical protein
MKAIIISLIITMIFFGTVTAGNGKMTSSKSLDSSAKAIHKVILKSLVYPDYGYNSNMTGDVVITFTVTEDGKIDVKKISSESEGITKWIKDQLSKITIKNVYHPINQEYRIKITLAPG